mmetsp:Transcript_26612/g.62917  ORF Transcript_26612/g.62917 Transcript_26612/m.62917 type:complete len:294 (+) Transcript_26612:150-1031(+)
MGPSARRLLAACSGRQRGRLGRAQRHVPRRHDEDAHASQRGHPRVSARDGAGAGRAAHVARSADDAYRLHPRARRVLLDLRGAQAAAHARCDGALQPAQRLQPARLLGRSIRPSRLGERLPRRRAARHAACADLGQLGDGCGARLRCGGDARDGSARPDHDAYGRDQAKAAARPPREPAGLRLPCDHGGAGAARLLRLAAAHARHEHAVCRADGYLQRVPAAETHSRGRGAGSGHAHGRGRGGRHACRRAHQPARRGQDAPADAAPLPRRRRERGGGHPGGWHRRPAAARPPL